VKLISQVEFCNSSHYVYNMELRSHVIEEIPIQIRDKQFYELRLKICGNGKLLHCLMQSIFRALVSLYSRVRSRFAAVRFTTIHFYDPCRVRPSTRDLRCITVATQGSFLYLVRFYLFLGVHVFPLFLFWCSSFKLTVIFPPMTSIKKTEKKKKPK